jgi:hypothetical protein
MKTTKLMKVKRHIMLPEWLMRKVEKEAASQGFDFSSQLTRLCERWIAAGCPESFEVLSLQRATAHLHNRAPIDPEKMFRDAVRAATLAAKGQ